MPAEDNNTRERRAAGNGLLEMEVGAFDRWTLVANFIWVVSVLGFHEGDHRPGLLHLVFGTALLHAMECVNQFNNTGVLDRDVAKLAGTGLLFGCFFRVCEPWLSDMSTAPYLYGSPNR